ncbi:MAG: PDZ domain-containing protein, partial [Coriobacteriia bacterium]|nr:PDZ domain-containing protein [Coriobacteriia bacterium]
EPNSPAAAGGLERGDIIVKIDGRTIEGTEDVFGAVRARKVGDRVAVVVVRGDAERTFELILASDSVRN